MNFEDLQKSWQTQTLSVPVDSAEKRHELTSQWQKQQRKVKRSNTITTVAFIGVFINTTWVYTSFHHKYSMLFGGSLLFMSILMLIYLGVMWQGYAYKKSRAALSSKDYIDYSIHTLQWRRKTIITYIWIYTVLLWLAFMLYCTEITRGGTVFVRFIIPACITVYIFGMQTIMRFTQQKKRIREIDELIHAMQQLKDNL